MCIIYIPFLGSGSFNSVIKVIGGSVLSSHQRAAMAQASLQTCADSQSICYSHARSMAIDDGCNHKIISCKCPAGYVISFYADAIRTKSSCTVANNFRLMFPFSQ